MASRDGPPYTFGSPSARRDSMRHAHIMRSNTFQWALAVAGMFAVFIIVLFGFIYWQTDQYLITRTDRMIAGQVDAIMALSGQRQLDAIDEHLKQDSRGVQYAGLFGADGRRIAGNLEQVPPGLTMNGSVQGVSIVRTVPAGRDTRVIRAIAARRWKNFSITRRSSAMWTNTIRPRTSH